MKYILMLAMFVMVNQANAWTFTVYHVNTQGKIDDSYSYTVDSSYAGTVQSFSNLICTFDSVNTVTKGKTVQCIYNGVIIGISALPDGYANFVTIMLGKKEMDKAKYMIKFVH